MSNDKDVAKDSINSTIRITSTTRDFDESIKNAFATVKKNAEIRDAKRRIAELLRELFPNGFEQSYEAEEIKALLDEHFKAPIDLKSTRWKQLLVYLRRIGEAKIEWSEWRPTKEWRERFDMSQSTFARLIKDGKIRQHPDSTTRKKSLDMRDVRRLKSLAKSR